MTKYASGSRQGFLKCVSCKFHGDDNECCGASSDHFGHCLARFHPACDKLKPIVAEASEDAEQDG